VPPAVTLLNYISSGLLWRIFCQTGIFAGFSLHIIKLAVRISAAVMAEDIIHFSIQYWPEGTAKLRLVGRGGGGEGRKVIVCFRVPNSFLGFSVAQEGAEELSKMQCISVGCSLAQRKDGG
jgi:hypothetical protein